MGATKTLLRSKYGPICTEDLKGMTEPAILPDALLK
jgi:hypothetical protein